MTINSSESFSDHADLLRETLADTIVEFMGKHDLDISGPESVLISIAASQATLSELLDVYMSNCGVKPDINEEVLAKFNGFIKLVVTRSVLDLEKVIQSYEDN